MTKHCINQARVTYDFCRHCNGKDTDCPEYLDGKFEYRVYHSRQTKVSIRRQVTDNSLNVPIGREGNSSVSADTYNHSRDELPSKPKVHLDTIPNSLEEWLKQKTKRIGDGQ